MDRAYGAEILRYARDDNVEVGVGVRDGALGMTIGGRGVELGLRCKIEDTSGSLWPRS